MKVLLYEWNSIGQQDLIDNLIKMGHKVDKINYIFEDFENDEAFEKRLSDLFLTNIYDCVISFNYFQIISKICNIFFIKYIAWVWDSPLINLFSKTIYNPCNYVFIFDKELFLRLKKLNVNTIYYFPLGVNVDRLDSIDISVLDVKEYNADVSFVGNLYENRNQFDSITNLPDYLKGYFDGIMKAQMKINGYNFIEDMLTEDVLEKLYQFITINMGSNFIGNNISVFADLFINAKITGIERRTLLKKLSEIYKVTLYSDSKSIDDIPDLIRKERIDYYTVMPKVFKCSKINLNFTSRTIKSGIPLRVFDVLGAGGFLITNYQSELPDYFELGKDLICYDNEKDLIDLVGYYLGHEEERKLIASNGYQKVKKYHNYQEKLKKIFDIVFETDRNNTEYDLEINSFNINQKLYIENLKQKLNEFIANNLMEECINRYYLECRENSFICNDNMINELKIIFDIYNYENKRNQFTFFDYSKDINTVYSHYCKIKEYVKQFEEQIEDNFEQFNMYIDQYQVSYTAIGFIILKFSKQKLKVLNDMAIMFFNYNKIDMVIPFLSLALEVDSSNELTFLNLGLVLYNLNEYEMALEYLNNIKNPTSASNELIEEIYKKL